MSRHPFTAMALAAVVLAGLAWLHRRLVRVSSQLRSVVSAVHSAPSQPLSNRAEDLLASITNCDPSYLAQALDFAQRAYENEERRRETIETKATTLISALGIAVTVAVSAGGLLLANTRSIADWAMVSLAGSYVVIVIALICALWHAVAAVRVAFAARPDPTEFLELQDKSLQELTRNQVASLLCSCQRNFETNNEKAGRLHEGHAALYVAAAALVVATCTIGVYSVLARFVAP